jgi:hypothetical protein
MALSAPSDLAKARLPLNPKMLESAKRKKKFNSMQQSTQDFLAQQIVLSKASAKKRRTAMQGMTS